MILRALHYEARSVIRSRAGWIGLFAFLAACAFAIFSGEQFRKEWTSGLDEAAVREAEAIEQVRAWFDEGVKGPEDRPWVDIHHSSWQDWYAGTRIERLPSGLAGIAAGSIDDSPRVLPINRRTDPFLSEGAKLENPELGRTERLDLAFVFTVFIPLLVGIMGVACGSREREFGIVRLIAIQRGRASSWFLARSVAFTMIASLIVAVCALASVLVAGVPVLEGVGFIGLSVIYTVVWGGLLTATAVAASNMREAAMAYGTVWLVLVVLLPSVLAERAIVSEATDPAIQTSLEVRKERYAAFEQTLAVLVPALYNAFPTLTDLPAAQLEEVPPSNRRLVYDGLGAVLMRDRHETALMKEKRVLEGADLGMMWSPAVAFTMAMESMAGRDLESAMEFRNAAVEAISRRVEWTLTRAWRNEPLTREDFENLVAHSPAPVLPDGGDVGRHAVVLVVWGLLAWSAGALRVRRARIEP